MHFPPYFYRYSFTLLRCLIPLIWLVLSFLALYGLRKKSLGETARALWALMIIAIPILGAAAFWVVNPHETHQDDGGVG